MQNQIKKINKKLKFAKSFISQSFLYVGWVKQKIRFLSISA